MNTTPQPLTGRSIRVLATLVEIGPCHVVKLAAILNEHPIPIDRTCAQLHADGRLRRQHGGVYTITKRGRAALVDDHE